MKLKDYLNEKLNEAVDSDIENLIRDHLSGTDRKVTKASLFAVIKKSTKVSKKQFDKIFNELVDDEFLVKTKDGKYTWEM